MKRVVIKTLYQRYTNITMLKLGKDALRNDIRHPQIAVHYDVSWFPPNKRLCMWFCVSRTGEVDANRQFQNDIITYPGAHFLAQKFHFSTTNRFADAFSYEQTLT